MSEDRIAASSRRYGWLVYVVAAGLAIVAEILVLRLWQADLRIPLQFTGDAAFGGAIVKGMIENGRLWVNQSLGAPGAMNLLDYPSADLLHYAAMKAISVFNGNWAFALNVYYLLGFPLAATTATWAFRRLGLSAPVGVGMGLLYAFLPYHLMSGEAHLFLSAYYMVPPIALLALELSGDRPPLIDTAGPAPKLLSMRSRSSWLPVAICLLAGSAGIYYVFFGAFFLLLGGLVGWWRRSERSRITASLLLIAAMLLSTAVNLAPFMWYRFTVPKNVAVARRGPVEAEVYALKITQVVLPVYGHRVGFLASIRSRYLRNVTAVFGPLLANEADFVALGIVGVFGFVLLVGFLIFGARRARSPDAGTLYSAASLNGAGLLLATTGGFGALFALGYPQIRAYNRIIVFLGLFAFFAAGWAIDRIGSKLRPSWRRWGVLSLVVVITVLGLLDQTTPAMVPDYAATAANWRSTGGLVRQTESGLKDGATVLQLPYVPFPENPAVVNMTDYDHFKPYLQSSKIHWSYGAVKGRPDADWLSQVSALPATQMVPAIQAGGFVGVWVDRFGYADQGRAIMSSLEAQTGAPPTISADERYAFFALGR